MTEEPARFARHYLQQLRACSVVINDFCESFSQADRFTERTNECCQCREKFTKIELIALLCGHFVCNECCIPLVETIRKLAETQPQLRAVDGLVGCPRCHRLCVLEQATLPYAIGFAVVQRFTFRMHPELSRLLVSVVEHIYENQRRGIFGAFSADNLKWTDFRGPWSDQQGNPLLKTAFTLPNASWLWVGDWQISYERDCDREGWRYAFNWPRTGLFSGDSEWTSTATLLCWVRQRQLDRVRLRLSMDDLQRIERIRPFKEEHNPEDWAMQTQRRDLCGLPAKCEGKTDPAFPAFQLLPFGPTLSSLTSIPTFFGVTGTAPAELPTASAEPKATEAAQAPEQTALEVQGAETPVAPKTE
eukprot:TRINITY_DN81584_c0_g1_i1.p1 TRINITY_DN81584_c0_g1~~TRINITY_DN81584_c0_g1_i1.p1  ORF type:complete len:372 (+),score=46.69 TRINITY_DN81584_c0_g1_i1:39-1118(+)